MIFKRKKDHEKKPWFLLGLLSVLFYGGLLFLTVFAQDIHNARLPQVTTSRPMKQKFSYTLTGPSLNGTTVSVERSGSFTALPKDMVDTGKVFTLQSVSENDFTYYYAKKISVVVDNTKENAEYYAIISGITSFDTFIMTGWETLEDGDEVFVINTDKKKEEHTSSENLFE